MQGNIDQLISLIAKHFKFDEKTYPELKGASEEERLAFAVKHSALHFAKTAGKIAAVSEDADASLDTRTTVELSLANTAGRIYDKVDFLTECT